MLEKGLSKEVHIAFSMTWKDKYHPSFFGDKIGQLN